jgi:hypothetical protein
MASGLYVIKRDGRPEEVHFDKITERIKKLTYGLDKRYIDPVRIPRGLCARTSSRQTLQAHIQSDLPPF